MRPHPIPSPHAMSPGVLCETRCACAGRGERRGPKGTHGDSRLRQHPFIVIVRN